MHCFLLFFRMFQVRKFNRYISEDTDDYRFVVPMLIFGPITWINGLHIRARNLPIYRPLT